jgi:Golgi nucleoside diphosphatase
MTALDDHIQKTTMHYLEDPTSWKLFQQRQEQLPEDEATLVEHINDEEVDNDNDDEEEALVVQDVDDQQRRQLWGDISHPLYSKRPPLYKTKHKKTPEPGGKSVHAMMIDAGSQGTRIHIYEYDRRLLATKDDILASANGEKLSYPSTNSRWTNKFQPGLDSMAEYDDDDELLQRLTDYLGPLVDFARNVLSSKKKDWKDYPIYLKATGGMRELPTAPRVRVIQAVRTLLNNKTFNPFSFEDERARVISGEEEAIYGWAAVNFAKGSLIETSLGTGTVLNPNNTIGSVEMGGASTQIGLFINSGDVMANLFKLQIGAARHWNVYVHSFLYFGVNSAYSRLNAKLVWKNTTVNPCLPSGSAVKFETWYHLNDDGQFLPRSSPLSIPYTVTMMNNVTTGESGHEDSFEQCSQLTYSLLRKGANKEWVEFSHDGDCSFAGVYQPPLPRGSNGIDEYIATGNYADVFSFLKLGSRATVSSINDAAKKVCELSWEELQRYNKKLSDPIDGPFELAQYCFRSVFVYQTLRNGYGFQDDSNITAVDVLNGRKLTWALGSILYEINTLPWEFHHKVCECPIGQDWNNYRISTSCLMNEYEFPHFNLFLFVLVNS